jgi:glycosyltransferase involved in cell wall biosynthesis
MISGTEIRAPRSDRTGEERQPVLADARTQELVGQNIICFAKDWEEDPTSNNHIMRLLAKRNRVLWVNSIATRKPDLRKARDLTKIFRKLLNFFLGPKHISNGLWVYTPIVLPLPHSRIANKVNTWILRLILSITRRRLRMGAFQLWVFLPTAAKFIGKLGESLVVYYVTDEYSKFEKVEENAIAANDRTLCAKAHVVFATAQSLVERRLPLNAETHLARHGVEYVSFASALDDATQVPVDLMSLPAPVLGFCGTVSHWIDYDLIAYLARRHPEWSVALIGQCLADVSQVRQLRNVHLLGRKPHHELPKYFKGMSVALIPHKVNGLTLHMNPIKLREYLSAGLPVVSVALPEVEPYAGHCWIARNYEEFDLGVMEAIANDSPQRRRARSESMRSETWDRRLADICRTVMRVQSERLNTNMNVSHSARRQGAPVTTW